MKAKRFKKLVMCLGIRCNIADKLSKMDGAKLMIGDTLYTATHQIVWNAIFDACEKKSSAV